MSTQYTNRKSIGWTDEQWGLIEWYAHQVGLTPTTAVRLIVMERVRQAMAQGPAKNIPTEHVGTDGLTDHQRAQLAQKYYNEVCRPRTRA